MRLGAFTLTVPKRSVTKVGWQEAWRACLRKEEVCQQELGAALEPVADPLASDGKVTTVYEPADVRVPARRSKPVGYWVHTLDRGSAWLVAALFERLSAPKADNDWGMWIVGCVAVGVVVAVR